MNIRILFIIPFSFIVLQSCAVFNKKEGSSADKAEMSLKMMQSAKEHYLIKATKNRLLNEHEKALAYINEAIKNDSMDYGLFYERAKILLALNDFDNAYGSAQRAWQLSEKNLWVGEFFAGLNMRTGMYDKATAIFEDLVRNNANKAIYHIKLAQLYERDGVYDKAVKHYKKVIELRGGQLKLVRKIANIQFEMGKTKEPLQMLKHMADEFAGQIQYKNLLGEFYLKADKHEQALNIFKDVLKEKAKNGRAYHFMARIYLKTNEKGKGFAFMQKTFTAPDLGASEKVNMYNNYFKEYLYKKANYKEGVEAVKKLGETHQDNIRVNRLSAEFYMHHNELQKARNVLLKLVKRDASSSYGWNRLIEIDMELNDYEKLYKHTNDALVYFVSNPAFYFYNGLAAYFLDMPQRAISSLKDAKSLINDDAYFLTQINTFIGEAYYSLSNSEEAFRHFEQVLQIAPDNIQVLNNYSYYLAMEGKKLNKAHEMITKVIKKKPGDPVYLDTYAWVLYKKGNYTKALEIIRRAYNKGGNSDADVLEHYGDILFKNEEVSKALKYWKKALDKGEDNAALKQKIKTKQLK